MSRALLDVNMLIALLDQGHESHLRARGWLEANIGAGWASCAITQNGFVRITSQSGYASPLPMAAAIERLREACAAPAHEFWDCSTSLLDPADVDAGRVHGPRQVTDVYLLALAAHHGGRLVTLDRSVSLSAVPRATPTHLVVL